jgi:hypothetical protein
MLESTPGKGVQAVAVKDIAELLLEGVERKLRLVAGGQSQFKTEQAAERQESDSSALQAFVGVAVAEEADSLLPADRETSSSDRDASQQASEVVSIPHLVERKKWNTKQRVPPPNMEPAPAKSMPVADPTVPPAIERKKWTPKSSSVTPPAHIGEVISTDAVPEERQAEVDVNRVSETDSPDLDVSKAGVPQRKIWKPRHPPTGN